MPPIVGQKGLALALPPTCTVPSSALQMLIGCGGGRPQTQGWDAVNFPVSLGSDKHPSSKTQDYVSPAAAGVWTPAPVLDPVLLGSWCTCREDKGKIWSEEK